MPTLNSNDSHMYEGDRPFLKPGPVASRKGTGEAGYTLIELLVVLAILALLVGIATPMVLKYLDSAKVSVARVQEDNLNSALDLFKLDMGQYPSQEEGLQALVTPPPSGANGWHGPYVKAAANLNDPWGHPFHYREPGDHNPAYDLWSDGPHGMNNDAKPEISNW